MDKQYVENEFNAFIAFPTADKNVVSSASAKLFAEHIAYPLECEIDTLREDVRVLHANNRVLIDQRFDLMEVTAKQSAALKLAREAIVMWQNCSLFEPSVSACERKSEEALAAIDALGEEK